MTSPMVSPGLVAIIGSGELSDAMAETHRMLLAQRPGPAKPVFIGTPAGFETNIGQIETKAGAYFRRNFGLDLVQAPYHAQTDNPATVAAAVTAIQQASYLMAGPGSPTYAVRTWRDSQVWRAMRERWQAGATLVFASAAALTLGRFTLPVYEIYKAGADLAWTDGLNLLDWLGSVAVIPHWNNASGEQHDTRYCFMGASRFSQLEAMLPPETLLLGVDEYTCLLIDPRTCQAQVFGPGQVTLRQNGQQAVFGKGETFQLDHWLDDRRPSTADRRQNFTVALGSGETLSGAGSAPDEAVGDILALREAVRAAIGQGDWAEVVHGLVALSLMAGAGLEQGRNDRAERAVESLQVVLPGLAEMGASPSIIASLESERGALLDLLVAMRAELRQARQFGLADTLRDQLIDMGYVLEDGVAGTTWRRS